ncbi:MAG: response regulator [Comamonadaceae bacterium]|nr:MAG: response regulator [Comamonadaceae bacterium]
MHHEVLSAYVVEDNPVVCENLIAALRELTCVRVVGSSATEDESHRWLAENAQAWDLVIVDLFLKAGSGLALLGRIRRAKPNQKIIVFSNFTNPDMRKRCAMLGVDAVFDKSTEIDALVDYCSRQCFEQVSGFQAL